MSEMSTWESFQAWRERTSFSRGVDSIMLGLRKAFVSVAKSGGLVTAALPPALMFTYATSSALYPTMGPFAWAVGCALGLTLEFAGVTISHVALDYFGRWQETNDSKDGWLFGASTIFTLGYLAIGLIAIDNFETQHDIVRQAGFLSYGVAAIMYVASALELLKDKVENGVVATLKAKMAEQTAELSRRARRITKLDEAIEKAKSHIDSLRQERDKLRLELTELVKVKSELDSVVTERDSLSKKLDSASQELTDTRQERDSIRQERDSLRLELSKLDSNSIGLDRLPAPLVDYVTMVANGVTPDGDFVTKYPNSKTAIERANSLFLKGMN